MSRWTHIRAMTVHTYTIKWPTPRQNLATPLHVAYFRFSISHFRPLDRTTNCPASAICRNFIGLAYNIAAWWNKMSTTKPETQCYQYATAYRVTIACCDLAMYIEVWSWTMIIELCCYHVAFHVGCDNCDRVSCSLWQIMFWTSLLTMKEHSR